MRMISFRKGIYVLAVMLGVGLYSCSTEDRYVKLEKQELAKGQRQDSLFLGISFGMTSKEFYGYCWELNKKGILFDGNNNTMVLYKLDTGMKYPASMNFYPDFHENKVFHMRVTFEYNAWAPWNKSHYSDTLLPDVLKLYHKWYPGGNDFIQMTNAAKETIYIKVDGNRRIIVGKQDDRIVRVDYTDLLVEKKLKK